MGMQEGKGLAGLLLSCHSLRSSVPRAVKCGGARLCRAQVLPGAQGLSAGPSLGRRQRAEPRQSNTRVSDVCLSLWPARRSPSKSTRALWTSNHGGWIFLEANQSVVTVQVQTSQTQPAKLHRSTVCRGKVGEPAYLASCAKSTSYQTWVLFREIAIRSRSVNRLWIVKYTLF